MSEPLNTGIKRIIWVATDKKHRVVGVWCRTNSILNFKEWKDAYDKYYYITKHEIWV